jgi:hypothetical protein
MTTKINASVVGYITSMTAGTISLTNSTTGSPNTGTLEFGRPGITSVKITAGEGTAFTIAGGTVSINDTTDATADATGALIVSGGASIAKKIRVGGTANIAGVTSITDTTAATDDYLAGALIVSGGAVFKKDIRINGDVHATYFRGTATAAQYQDVAEKYVPDAEYFPGTVVSFGGEKEITLSTTEADTAIAGVISTAPAYMMGTEIEGGVYVALLGRVPCKVVGTIKKGDLIVSSGIPGVATSYKNLQPGSPPQGSVIGKALENYDNFDQIGVIEVVVGRV